MSFFFGKKSKVKPQYTGLQLQTSSSTQAITLLWGGNRLSINLFWYGDFTAHKQKQKAGKGMGGSTEFYTYSASIQGGLCEGVISGIGVVYKDDEKTTMSALGFTLFTGTYPQAPWGYLTSKHPDKALNYEGVAYVAIANYDLGQQASLGNHTFETFGISYNTAPNGHDADCAVVVKDFLTNPQYGAGFGLNRLDEDQLFSTASATTTGDDSYQTYCRAMGFGLSPALSEPTDAGDILARWAMLTNSAVVWNGYKLKMVPYAREIVEGNGVKYVPPQLEEPAYVLTDADWLNDPKADRSDQSQCPNIVSIEINNRFNEYNELPVEYRDQSLIDQYGERKANSITASEITDPDMAAEMVSLIAARSAYVRNTWEIHLGQEYVLLEPTDTLVLTLATGALVLVQIISIEEDEENKFKIEAEEIANGLGGTGGFTSPGTATPVVYNSGVLASPVNPPIIFEPAASLTSGVPQVWAAVSGGNGATADPNWGGCNVYISTDNITYQNVGVVDSPARMGKLTASLPAYGGANPDNTNTLKVNLLMSGGELQGVTAAEAANGSTMSWVDGEILSYKDALLTSSNNYTASSLYRGLGFTAAGAHAVGTLFARLDENIFKYNLPADYIGKLLYLKFQSFNIWNKGVQDLDDCVAYTYTTVGAGYGSGSGGKPAMPTGFAASNGPQSATLTWNANSVSDNVTTYNVWRAAGTGAVFGSATKVATVNALNYRDSTLAISTGYTYFLTAQNSVGESVPTAGINLTTPAGQASFSGFEVDDSGTPVDTAVTKLNFKGSGVTVSRPTPGAIDLDISGGGGGGGGGGSGALVKVAEFIATGGEATWSFSPPAGFDDLVIVTQTRSTNAVVEQALCARINGDSTNSYWDQRNGAAGATDFGNSAQRSYMNIGQMPGASGSASMAGTSEIQVFNYTGSFYKRWQTLTGRMYNTTGANFLVDNIAGQWNNVAAISSVEFFPVAGAFAAGSKIVIYGRGGLVGGGGSGGYFNGFSGDTGTTSTTSEATKGTYFIPRVDIRVSYIHAFLNANSGQSYTAFLAEVDPVTFEILTILSTSDTLVAAATGILDYAFKLATLPTLTTGKTYATLITLLGGTGTSACRILPTAAHSLNAPVISSDRFLKYTTNAPAAGTPLSAAGDNAYAIWIESQFEPDTRPNFWDPPLASDFPNDFNFGGGNLVLTDDPNAGLIVDCGVLSGGAVRSKCKPLPGGDFSVTMRIKGLISTLNFSSFGIAVYGGVNRTLFFSLDNRSDIRVEQWNGSVYVNVYVQPVFFALYDPFIRVTWTAATNTYLVEVSTDGHVWVDCGSFANPAGFPNPPTHVGINGTYARTTGPRNKFAISYWKQSW